MKHINFFYALLFFASSLFAMQKRPAEGEPESSCTVKKERTDLNTITLTSNDDQKFIIKYNPIEEGPTPINLMGIIKDMVGDLPTEGESITIPNLNGPTLQAILHLTQKLSDYLKNPVDDAGTFQKRYIEDFIHDYPLIKKHEALPDSIDLLMAANYLNIKELLNIICLSIAQQLHAIEDLKVLEPITKKIDTTLSLEMQLPIKEQLELLCTIYYFGKYKKILSNNSYPAAISPDSNYILYTRNNTGYIWNTKKADQEPHKLPGTIIGGMFSPDGRLLATISENKLIKIFALSSLDHPKAFTLSRLPELSSFSPTLAWSPNGNYLAVAFPQGIATKLKIYTIDPSNLGKSSLSYNEVLPIRGEEANDEDVQDKPRPLFLNNHTLMLASRIQADVLDLRDINAIFLSSAILPPNSSLIIPTDAPILSLSRILDPSSSIKSVLGTDRRSKSQLSMVSFSKLASVVNKSPELKIIPYEHDYPLPFQARVLSPDGQYILGFNSRKGDLILWNRSANTTKIFIPPYPLEYISEVTISHHNKCIIIPLRNRLEIVSTEHPFLNNTPLITSDPHSRMLYTVKNVKISSDDSFVVANIITKSDNEPGPLVYLPLFPQKTAEITLAQLIALDKLYQLGNDKIKENDYFSSILPSSLQCPTESNPAPSDLQRTQPSPTTFTWTNVDPSRQSQKRKK